MCLHWLPTSLCWHSVFAGWAGLGVQPERKPRLLTAGTGVRAAEHRAGSAACAEHEGLRGPMGGASRRAALGCSCLSLAFSNRVPLPSHRDGRGIPRGTLTGPGACCLQHVPCCTTTSTYPRLRHVSIPGTHCGLGSGAGSSFPPFLGMHQGDAAFPSMSRAAQLRIGSCHPSGAGESQHPPMRLGLCVPRGAMKSKAQLLQVGHAGASLQVGSAQRRRHCSEQSSLKVSLTLSSRSVSWEGGFVPRNSPAPFPLFHAPCAG